MFLFQQQPDLFDEYQVSLVITHSPWCKEGVQTFSRPERQLNCLGLHLMGIQWAAASHDGVPQRILLKSILCHTEQELLAFPFRCKDIFITYFRCLYNMFSCMADIHFFKWSMFLLCSQCSLSPTRCWWRQNWAFHKFCQQFSDEFWDLLPKQKPMNASGPLQWQEQT